MGYKIILGVFIFSVFLIGAVYYLYPDEQINILSEEVPEDNSEVVTYTEDNIPIDMVVDVQELGDCDGPIKCDRINGCKMKC